MSSAAGQVVEVVDRPTLLAAVQLGPADLHGQPAVTLLPAGQHQQVFADRVGDPQLRFRQAEGQFGAVQGAQAGVLRRLGEPDHAVEAVVVGERQRVQAERQRLGDQRLRRGRAVQEQNALWQCSSA